MEIKMTKHSKNCAGFLVAMIFFLLMVFASIPLFIIGFNKMNNDLVNKPFDTLFSGFQYNTEQILATTLSFTGTTMATIFLFMYINCK
jgi:hypothetical protein